MDCYKYFWTELKRNIIILKTMKVILFSKVRPNLTNVKPIMPV